MFYEKDDCNMEIKVNADDWGLEPIRDKAIVECFRRGWLNSTTAVMNRPGLDAATEYAHEAGIADKVGLHINLTYDKPLTDPIKRYRIFCDDDGLFNGAFHSKTVTRLWLPSDVKAAVATEISAQIRKYLEQGYTMMHADSHHHVHTDFAITPIVVALLREYGFRTMRISRNFGQGIGRRKALYKTLFRTYIRQTGLAHSDYFGSLQDFKDCGMQLPKNAKIELMCHPMFTIGREDREDGVLTDLYNPFDEAQMEGISKCISK